MEALHCVARRALNTRRLFCCQMSNDSTQKDDSVLSIRSQGLATTSVAPNCTCSSRSALSIKALNDYRARQNSGVLLSKNCNGAPCCYPMVLLCDVRQHVTSSPLFPLWSDMVAHANKLTSIKHLRTDLCSLSHISILLYSPSSPPMPSCPTFHQTLLEGTTNDGRCMNACVINISSWLNHTYMSHKDTLQVCVCACV